MYPVYCDLLAGMTCCRIADRYPSAPTRRSKRREQPHRIPRSLHRLIPVRADRVGRDARAKTVAARSVRLTRSGDAVTHGDPAIASTRWSPDATRGVSNAVGLRDH